METRIRFLKSGKHLDASLHFWADLDEDNQSEGDDNSDESGQDSNDDSTDGKDVKRRDLTISKLLDSLLVNGSSCDVLNLKLHRHFGLLLEIVLVSVPNSSEAEDYGVSLLVYFNCSGAA